MCTAITSSLLPAHFTAMTFSFLRFILLSICVLETSITFVCPFANNITDEKALLSIKASITPDPLGVLSSWNESMHFCQWKGVTCSRRRQRVTSLDLSSLQLVGTLSPHIGNLSFLRGIYLHQNKFHGFIPDEIGRLFRLQNLSLGDNSFQGGFPAKLSYCTNILFISLYSNNLEGELPTEFASWSKLDEFDIGYNRFSGSIPPSIGNISSLRSIFLDSNNLKGTIPNEIGKLIRLQYLELSYNSLQGEFPSNLTHCVQIRNISMFQNDLQGKLPTEFASWSKLYMFNLGINQFTGSIPPSIGNISSLRYIDLRRNNLAGGIPLEVVYHAKLEILALGTNNLSGMVPLPLYNISSLTNVSLIQNELEGTLPADMGLTLPKLQEFFGGQNRFSGSLPPSLANASNLVIFDIIENSITGPIPTNLGSLPNLQVLSLGQNKFGDNMRSNDLSFLDSLVNCTQLMKLGINENGLRGEFPNSIGNLSTTMEELYLYGNHIYGSIPHEIRKLVNMRIIGLYGNNLTGVIPESIGELSQLGELDLTKNNIGGVIPTSMSNISQLVVLSLEMNLLQGSIPAQLFNISALQILSLANNRLEGVIPEGIGYSSQYVSLYLQQNLFTGPLPPTIGSLKQLVQLDVSNNKLRGDIPFKLGDCVMLETLHMDGNLFQGRIPYSFKALKNLVFLDLSNNKLSGDIPSFFDGFRRIIFLNLSHNNLGGEVPKKGLFSNISAFSVENNLELCGGIPALHLSDCPIKVSRNKKKTFSLKKILLLVLVPSGIFLACVAIFCYRRRSFKKFNEPVPVPVLKHNQYLKLSYQDLLQATNEFSSNNLLGEGRYGSVYKGVLASVEHIVAVKVLKVEVRGASRSFLAECETLSNIRHRNLVKIITACSSTDFKGNDFKALVFKFMTNGSLDNWLHPSPSDHGNERNLTLLQRLNISIDVALGLEYLHHHSHASIIHSDIKPSNILLDEDFVAHIGDFGLARFSFATTTSDVNQGQMSSTGVRGTVGYIPPEYGMFEEISTEGDVYSYGILLLKIFSGKRPTESSILIAGCSNLHDYVKKALPQRVMDIADSRMVLKEDEHGLTVHQSYRRSSMEVCLASIFEVGILCSEEMPQKRIDISVAIKQLQVARDELLQCKQ